MTRTRAARIAVVLAAVLLPLAMLASWSSAILSDNDRYVDAVAPLAHDPAVQQAVIDQLTVKALTAFAPDQPGPCGGSAGTTSGLGAVADALMPLAEGPVRAIVAGIVKGPGFEKAWVGANRSAHQQLIGVLGGDDRLVDENGCISIDLTAVFREAVPQMTAVGGFRVPLPETRSPVASIAASDLDAARVGYAVLNPLGFWLPVLWLVAVLLALALGARKWRTLALLGAGSALALGALLVGLTSLRSSVAGSSGDPEVTRALWDAVAGSIHDAALAGLVVAILAGLGGAWMARRGDSIP